MKYFKRRANELEEYVNRYKIQIGDLSGPIPMTSQSETEVEKYIRKSKLN